MKSDALEEIKLKTKEVACLTHRMLMDLLVNGESSRGSKLLEECEEIASEVGAITARLRT